MSTDRATNPTLPIHMIVGYGAVLAVLVVVGYGSIATAFFVGDDYNILNIVQAASSIREATGIADGWEFFRPLTAITYWLNYLVFGLNATAFHSVDLVLHGINGMLVAYLTWSFTPSRISAAAAGALYVLYPMHAEAVCWIAGRFDQVYACGTLVCLIGWWRFLRGGGNSALSAAGLGLCIAVLGKDTGMIVPAFLLVLGLANRGASSARAWRGAGVLLGLFAAYFGLRWWILDGLGGYKAEHLAPLRIDLGVAARHVADAWAAMLAPGPGRTTGWVCLLAVIYAILHHRNRGEFCRRAWPLPVLFLLALAPAANTVGLGDAGENGRFLYLPSALFCVLLGVLFGTGRRPERDPRLWAAVLALLSCYGVNLSRLTVNWRHAGYQTETIVHQLQDLLSRRKYEFLFIHGLPDTHRGAYVFKNGFENALRLFVESDVKFPPHGRLTAEDWEEFAARRRTDPTTHPEYLLLRWLPDRQRLVEP